MTGTSTRTQFFPNSTQRFLLEIGDDLEGQGPDSASSSCLTGEGADPVPSEVLVPKPIDDGAEEPGYDVDEEEEDVADLQAQVGEPNDQRRLQRRNHEC